MLRRIVALLQGSLAVSCLVLVAKLLRAGSGSPALWGLVGGLMVLALLATWAGVSLWMGRTEGGVLTLILQLVHLVYLESSPLTVAISLPLATVIGMDPSFHWHSWLAWRPSIEITLESLDPTPWVGLNLVAVASVIIAVKELRRARCAPSPRVLP